MSMIEIKNEKDEFGRPIITYVDTDELNDEQYYEYYKLKREGKHSEAFKFIKSIFN